MKQIWKYPLKITDEQQILMPRAAKIVSAGLDLRGELCVWALVDPARPVHVRPFRIVGTGHPFEDTMWTFVGSVLAHPFMWHVFVFEIEGAQVEVTT
jgi:hypothetical protein